jgi:AcrR family transcriptional regulator
MTAASPKPVRRTAGRPATGAREAILSAADQVFGEVGFDSASTREIGERSEANKALIHYHFGNKEGLLEAVLDGYFERLGAEVRTALAGEGTLRERLVRLVDAYGDFLSENRRFCRIVQREAAGGKNAGRIQERLGPLFQLGKELLLEHYPTTRKGDLAAEQLFVSVYGMIITYFTYSDVIGSLVDSDPFSPKNLLARKIHIRRVVACLVSAVELEERRGDS